MNDDLVLPNIFLRKFIKQLSPDSFCVLLRFFKFQKKYGDHVNSISQKWFKYYILLSENNEQNESIWGELDQAELVKRDYKTNTYTLNLEKIEKDATNYSLIVTEVKEGKIRRKKIDEKLKDFIDKILSKYSEKLQRKINKLIIGYLRYISTEREELTLQDVRNLMRPFFKEEEDVIEKVCDIYLKNHYSTKPAEYIHGILKNVKKITKDKKKTFKKDNLADFRDDKKKYDNEFAIKLVTQDLRENESYQAYIKLDEISELKKLYKLGLEFLAKNEIKADIFSEYDWLDSNKV